jgi:hypothetical protein
MALIRLCILSNEKVFVLTQTAFSFQWQPEAGATRGYTIWAKSAKFACVTNPKQLDH